MMKITARQRCDAADSPSKRAAIGRRASERRRNEGIMVTAVWQRAAPKPDHRPADTPKSDAAANARLVRAAGGPFFWATRLLPAPRRRAMHALYGFWHAIEDDAPTATAHDKKLADWRYEVGQLFDGRPQHPVTRG